MTPKEKAKELVSNYVHLAKQTNGANGTIYNSKQCALIAVDEIETVLLQERVFESFDYWKEVKKEIEKL